MLSYSSSSKSWKNVTKGSGTYYLMYTLGAFVDCSASYALASNTIATLPSLVSADLH